MTQRRDSRGRLSERIADDLQQEILSEGLVPNRRLPTEVELMERYGVSRTVVREGARLLVQRGLVTVAPGRGMVVAEFDGAHIAEQFSVLMLASEGTFAELLELRLALEVQVATSAARSPSEDVLARLEQSVTAGEQLVESGDPINGEAYLDADITFHELLVEASGNPFFDLVCRPINSFLRSHYRHREHYPSDPRRTLEEHRRILDALQRGDTFAARQCTEAHLRRLMHKWPAPHSVTTPSVRALNTNDRLAQLAASSNPSQED